MFNRRHCRQLSQWNLWRKNETHTATATQKKKLNYEIIVLKQRNSHPFHK